MPTVRSQRVGSQTFGQEIKELKIGVLSLHARGVKEVSLADKIIQQEKKRTSSSLTGHLMMGLREICHTTVRRHTVS